MALITCPECGRKISDKAASCPHCGYPLMPLNTTEAVTDIIPTDDNIIAELLVQNNNNKIATIKALMHTTGMDMTTAKKKVDDYCSFSQKTSTNSTRIPSATKKIGPVQIDERMLKFRINGYIPSNGKKDGIGKTAFKGMMAVSTMGMSLLLPNRKQKVGNKEWLNFSDLLSYDLLEDDSVVTSGGVGQALIGGALFGGFGAIAGGITGKRTQKKKVDSLYIKVTVNNFSSPCILIPLITKSTKTNSKEYTNAFTLAHQILSALDVIAHNR